MLDPEGVIKAALLDVATLDADALAAELVNIALRQQIPFTALMVWIYGRPRPSTFAPREFLQWAAQSPEFLAHVRQTHPQFTANTPGNPPTPPGGP